MPRGRMKEGAYRICEVCEESFYKPPSHTAKWPAKTCSRKCAGILKSTLEKRVCPQCERDFSIRPSQLERGFGTYCSQKCYGLASRKPVYTACAFCGDDLVVTPHMATTRHRIFCSWECRRGLFKRYGIKQGENKFPKEAYAWLGDKCERCGSTSRLQLDHVVPRFAGGLPVRENAQTLCGPCNQRKFWYEDFPRYLGTIQQSE